MEDLAQVNMLDEIIVDNFAGGGGASTGIELAAGRPVTIAINHDPDAILMHKTNHPHTEHYQASVWDIDPEEVCRGRPVGLAWFSPDCKHFSKAKGGKPVDKNIRGLAWIALRWAGTVRPRIIILENVEEFQTWGPVRRGKPVKAKAGQTFQKFVTQLRDLGYTVEWRELVAADYGAPTIRKRFFLIARCDGKPVVWPEPSHGQAGTPEVLRGGRKPWRAVAEVIDWNQPCPSIFDSKEEVRARYGLAAVRPLADNTLRRVARGIDKFVIKSPMPFLVTVNHEVSAPWTVTNTTNSTGHPVGEPMDTARTGGGGGQMMVSPTLAPVVMTNTSGSMGGAAREPMHTATTAGNQALVAPALLQYHQEQSDFVRGQNVERPLCTVDAANRYGVIAPALVKYYGSDEHGQSVAGPAHTVTARDREALAVPFLEVHHAGGYHGKGNLPDKPLNTITTSGGLSLNLAHIVKFKGEDLGHGAESPLHTVTASPGGFGQVRTYLTRAAPGCELRRWPEVRELLNRYCGYHIGQSEVLVLEFGGVAYFIADIGLRMLTPGELYAANGFPMDYIIDRDYTGKPYGKSKQVARCGNAVPPPFATALVRANLPEWCGGKIETMKELEGKCAV